MHRIKLICGVAVAAIAFTVSVAATASNTASRTATDTQAEPCLAPHSNNPIFDHLSAAPNPHLIDTNNNVMVPYGITIFGMSRQDWQADSQPDIAEIDRAIGQWCTNYVRLQMSPSSLVPNCTTEAIGSCTVAKDGYNQAYLNEIENEVSEAISYHNNVILTAQTERYSNEGWAANPTEQTDYFWQVLAPIYKQNPRIWFDLFNEPHLCTQKDGSGNCTETTADKWSMWQNGGSANGHTYEGMQQLSDDVRAATGNNTNMIILEGIEYASTLAKMPGLPGNGGSLITGKKIVFGVHPYTEATQSVWDNDFGNAAATVPVIVDEWSEWDNLKPGKCHPDAATYVPDFFSYLAGKQIGLGAWGLIPGVLITESTNYTPTVFGSDYNCDITQTQENQIEDNQADNGLAHPSLSFAEGVGQKLETHFQNQSGIKGT